MRAVPITFIGLGHMGAPMCRSLLGAGFAVTVFNRSRPRADALAAPRANMTRDTYP